MRKNRTIAFYDALADTYDNLIANVGYTLAASTYEWMRPHLSVEPGSLLDIGIGTGLVSEPFAANGWTVTGIDGSPTMLAQVARKGIARCLIEADLSGGELPLSDDRFDAVTCIGVFEFVRAERLFFRNIARLCDPGAVFALAVRDPDLNPQFTHMELDGQCIDKAAYERDGVIAVHHRWADVLAELDAAGFELVEEKQVLAYRSPTQGFDTMNRVVLLRHNDAIC